MKRYMLTTDNKEEIRRLVGEIISELHSPFSSEHKNGQQIEHVDSLQNFVTRVRELIVNEGFTEISLINQETGERRVVDVFPTSDALADVTARAIEVFGTGEKAMRWFRTPVRALGNRIPMSLLRNPESIVRVQDVLGQIEHGVW